jgi:hypothetical protein
VLREVGSQFVSSRAKIKGQFIAAWIAPVSGGQTFLRVNARKMSDFNS